MKCAHPGCDRGIGLVSHRRWFSAGLYCSKACCYDYVTKPRAARSEPPRDDGFLAALFALPGARANPAPAPALVRVRRR
jgi:hypothetical protein